MAKLIFKGFKKEVEVEDGKEIKLACKDTGVLFGCEDGYCGTCYIHVEEGMENLSERTQAEKDMIGNNDPKTRLACQCKIKSGNVEISNY